MNAKSKLIDKLLKVAKKHKILTYPVLALVAVISVFHYFFSWSTGAGKRVVAVVMVLVMLVSQSYFLTSSATALVDTEETVQEQQELQEQSEEALVETEDGVSTEGDDLVQSDNTTEIATEVPTDTSEDIPADVVDSSEETSTEVSTDNTVNEEDSAFVDDTTEAVEGDTTGEVPVYSEDVEDAEKETATTEQKAVVKFVAIKEGATSEIHECYAVKNADSDTYRIDSSTWEADANKKLATNANDGNYLTYEGWYTSSDYTTKVDSVVANSLTVSDSNIIWLYAKRNITNYKVSIGSAGTVGDFSTSGATADANTSGVYAVPATVSGNSYTATFTIVKPERAGYKLAGIDAQNSGSGVSAVVSGDDLIVTLTGDSYQQHVQLAWTAEDYDIQYETAGGVVTRTVTYDGQESSDLILSETDVTVATKEGYVFAGWQTNGGAIQIPKDEAGRVFVSSKSALQSYAYSCAKNGTPAVLSPYYDYAGVELLQNSISYEYRKPQTEPIVITAVYQHNGKGSDSFSYALGDITDGSGTAVNPADYGITISADGGEAVTVVTGVDGPQEVITLKVDVVITDSQATEDDQKTSTKELTINITPRNLTLDTSKITDFVKTYDGTTDCAFKGEIPTNVDDVFVVISSSKFDSANAGDRTVLLTRPDTDWLKGDLAKNYNVDVNANGEFVVDGTIEQREVNIRTFAVIPSGRDYVRAGETNPTFSAEEIASDDTDKGLIAADKKRLNEIIKLTTDNERDDSSLTTSRDMVYRVVPQETADSNYKFIFNYNDLGTFRVRLESADTLFDAIGKTESGWYGDGSKVVAKADSGYNQIRIAAGQEVDELVLTEELAADERVTFQLYDSTTGAYTAFTTLPAQVDLTDPEFVSCEVIENGLDTGSGLFFPSEGGQVSLGHFYNKSITFRVSYRDTGSGASKLVYSLSGNLTDASDNAGQEITFVDRNDGVAVFTFTIPVRDLIDQKGGIQFYAVDSANNDSDPLNLCQEGDEWIVEKTAPGIDVVIKAGGTSSTDGITITGEDQETYYGNVKAYLSATDATSPITSITWVINDEEYVDNLTEEKLQVSATLPINADSFTPEEGGVFTVSAYVTDKAGNKSLETTPVTFKIDDVKPVVAIADGYDSYQQEVKLEFSAFDELSGVKYINVKDETTGKMIQHKVEKVEENEDGFLTSYCYVQTTQNGSYTIEVSDYAGNVFTETIVLDKVSNEVPECPSVTFSPEPNENGWITEKDAKALITNITETEIDGMPVDTKYKLWLEGEDARNITVIDSDAATEEILLSVANPLIDQEGVYVLSVWSQSATGVLCEGAEETAGHEFQIKIDTEKPVISEPSFATHGKTLTVSFEVTDDTSGVNSEEIKVLNGTREVPLTSLEANEDGNGYVASFEITTVGDYSIVASDIAGNVAENVAFRPMSLQVYEVQDLTYDSAYISALVKKGTFDIASATISYGKFDDKLEDYVQVQTTDVLDESGNLSVSTQLDNLEADTNYIFHVVAKSVQGEELTGTGAFKTLSRNGAGITITGTARYADPDKEGTITVGLFDGDVCVEATVVDTIQDTTRDESFTFENIPDGNYSLVAKDGTYTQTVKVHIKDGALLAPDSNNIDLVLSGLSTSVEITTDDTPHISVDFNNLVNDTVNYTEEDKALVESGFGTVEFKLYATIRYVEEVSADEKEAMYAVHSVNGKLVGAYIDLSLYKIVTDEKGVETRTAVHTLGNGANISVTVPLTEFLAQQSGKVVVGIHNRGTVDNPSYVANVYDPDYDTNPATYTFEANSFSTFALLYDPVKQEATTEEIKDGTLDPSDNGTINIPGDNTNEDPEEDDPEDIDEPDEDPEEDKESEDKGGSSVGSLRSSGSAKTGDASPIVLLFGMMLASIGGLIVLRKKVRD